MKILSCLILFFLIPIQIFTIKQINADSLSKKAVKIAKLQIGVVESPRNSNKGKQVESYLKSVNLSPGNPWCMSFVYWSYKSAADSLGVKLNLLKTGSCIGMWNWARGQRLSSISLAKYKVVRGDIMIMKNMNNQIHGHTGIVDSSYSNGVYTIEGNTSGDSYGSQDNGDGVYYKKRDFSGYKFLKIIGFIRLNERH